MISYEQYLDYSPYFAQVDIEAPSSRTEFLELINRASPSVKNFIAAMETAEKIFNMGASFMLDEYDTEAVAYVIRQITVGEIPVAKAIDALVREIKVSSDTAREILESCLRDVLTPIIEDVKKIQTLRFQNPQKQDASIMNQKNNPVSVDMNPSNVVDLRHK